MKKIASRSVLALAYSLLALSSMSAASARQLTAQPPELTPGRRQELLFDAARLGRADVIPAIIGAGADVDARDARDARGFTPLILAAYNGHLDAVEALLTAKADPCLSDAKQGNTALMGVAFRGRDGIAARLIKAGCDVNTRNNTGQTALMMAALFGRIEQVKMLLAAGADPSIKDVAGNSAASAAAAQGNTAVATLLADQTRR